MSSGLADGLADAMARGIVALGCACLAVGIAVGVVAMKACSAGWRVQAPITRSK